MRYLITLAWFGVLLANPGNRGFPDQDGKTADNVPLPKGAITRLGHLEKKKLGKIWITLGPLWVNFLKDGQTVATTGTDRKLIFWNAKTGKAIRTLEGHVNVAFSPEETIIASRGEQKAKVIRLLEIATGKETGRVVEERDRQGSFCFSPDGRLLFLGGGTQSERPDDPTLCAWEVATSKMVKEFPLRKVVRCITLSADGKLLATLTYFGQQAQIWDAKTAMELRRFKRERVSSGVSMISLSPDGEFLATVGSAPAVRLLAIGTGEERWQIRRLDFDGALSVAFSPNARMMAVGTGSPEGGKVYLIEYATGQVRCRFEHGGDNKVLVFSVVFQGMACFWPQPPRRAPH
jgi:WD40 repeat protein